MEFYVIVRPGTVEFFKSLRRYFNFHIVTQIMRELVMKLLPLIDPDGVVF